MRPRISELLRRAMRRPITLVTGPPGAGKTIAVRSWAATPAPHDGPVVWLSCGEASGPGTADGPLCELAEGLSLAGVIDRAMPLRPGNGAHDLAIALASTLSAPGVRVVLVLDDVRPRPGWVLSDFVGHLVEHAGPGVRIVVTARGDPPIAVHRYRLADQLSEIGAADLAFDEEEIAWLLDRHGVRLGTAALRVLVARTEGWAAGVRLAASALASRLDPDAFAERVSGEDHAVVGYVWEEALDAQPPELQRLLLATSVTDRVNSELAVELAGEEAGARFAELVRRNAFLAPLEHGWYRCQPMIRDALRRILDDEAPGAAAALTLRAARWFDRSGHLTDAVALATRGGDWSYAARLVVDRLAIGRVLCLCADDPLPGILHGLPHDLAFAAPEPEPALMAAAVAVGAGDDRAGAVALQHAERLSRGVTGPRAHRIQVCAGLIRLARGRADDMDEPVPVRNPALLLRFPGRRLDEHPELRALLLSARAGAALRAGRFQETTRLLDLALAAATQAGGDHRCRSCLGLLALVEALGGRFARAAEFVTRAERMPEVSSCPPGRRAAAVHLADAWVRLERYELRASGTALARAGIALRERPDHVMSAVSRLLAARLEIAHGRPERALRLLGSDRDAAERVPWLERRLRLVTAQAHLAAGAPGPARVAAEQAGGVGSPRSALTLARTLLARGERPVAADMIRTCLASGARVPPDVSVEAWLLEAHLAYEAAGRHGSAAGRRALDRAFRLADREQIRLPFAPARPWLRPVLRHDPDLARPYQRLLGPLRLVSERPARAGADDAPAVERPSARELDVLLRVARMMTTEEVAADLCLSVNTVKTHLKSVYRKLGVTRRGEAVRRARRLSLLQEEADNSSVTGDMGRGPAADDVADRQS
jgi:LuxR family maltose regulon positive regulatory protein